MSRRVRVRVVAVVAALGGACTTQQAPDLGGGEQAIVGGTVDPGDPAVVALTIFGVPFCSGTVVAPRVVVTAAHCLDPNVSPEFGDVTLMQVFFGTDANTGAGTYIPIVAGGPHPEFRIDALSNGADIGVVALARDAPAAPVRMSARLATSWSDQPARLVGFGVDNGQFFSGGGIKREVTTTIFGDPFFPAVDDFYLFRDQTDGRGSCYGDSGGPLFADDGGEVLIGVTSFGDFDCTRYGASTRADLYIDTFIQPFIDAHGGGAVPRPSSCEPGTPDAAAPVIHCPADRTVCASDDRPFATSVAAADDCGRVAVTCAPPNGTALGAGTSTIACTATDPAGRSSSCELEVTTRSGTTMQCPAHLGGECNVAPDLSPIVVTSCSPQPPVVSCDFDRSVLGTRPTHCTASDATGVLASCDTVITVADTLPPVVDTFATRFIELSPPNHKYRTIRLGEHATAYDACDGPIDLDARGQIIDTYTNEAEDDRLEDSAAGDGHTCNDIVMVSNSQVKVRAERRASGPGRWYAVTFVVADAAGNWDYGQLFPYAPRNPAHPPSLDTFDRCAWCADGTVGGDCLAPPFPCPLHDPVCSY